MDKFDYQTIKQIVFDLMSAKELKGKIFIVGVAVAYLYAGIDSNRLHNDIVQLDDMPIVRAYLNDMNYYDEVYDSLNFSIEELAVFDALANVLKKIHNEKRILLI